MNPYLVLANKWVCIMYRQSLLNIGFENYVMSHHVCGIISPDSAPMKRYIRLLKDQHVVINATGGRKVKSVVVMANKTIYLSAIGTTALRSRIEGVLNE